LTIARRKLESRITDSLSGEPSPRD
jgi:hypothetical protein